MHSLRIVVALILFLSMVAAAQAVVTLNIYVEDARGDPVHDAAVYVGDSYIGSTSSEGWISYTHSGTSSFRLRVAKSGYESRSVTVQRSETTRTVMLEQSSVILTVLVYDENIAPLKDAIVRVVGPSSEKTEDTGSDGKAVFSLPDGSTYEVYITSLDYRDTETSVQLSGSNREISVVMERGDRFAFRVIDDETQDPVSGAEVLVDGRSRGTTRDDGVLSYNLRKGYEYLITVKKPEYEAYSMRQYITGDQQVLTIPLQKAYHTSFVSVFDTDKRVVEGADVFMDGTLLRKTDSYGRASLGKLTTGTYHLEIRKAGFEDYSEEITVSEDSMDFIANLAYSAVPIRVHVQDSSHAVIPGATITVNEENKGTTDESGLLFISLNPGRDYSIAADKDGYHQATISHTVPVGGKQDSVTITLKRSINFLVIGGAAGAVILLAFGLYFMKGRIKTRTPKSGSSKRYKQW
ncbi:MAG: hypothetical protein D5R99_04145 [Methanocalculus sp. MSAO_Arc1]|uniref:carboxypeptidase-like regulatory domain-containing protein n=1 Tax=Methanocalculus TaxID=71151 RepID=UPI000FF52B64|nr:MULTISPECIES: carboxypeptidase-like regulatory domain-containing protein [unclassified Methanocalculus]MCP1662969.1 hypothetical protein [Methanocalculus sp. AMF5]RQD80740.1 MAG: hypothetical protein D5R99_04145 [Methanocalculus sp. MSAO_Arc1]